jgi:hypothetical protein
MNVSQSLLALAVGRLDGTMSPADCFWEGGEAGNTDAIALQPW